MRVTRNGVLLALTTLALSGAFLWKVDLSGVARAMVRADAGALAAALAATAFAYVIRIWRWQVLLGPLGHFTFVCLFRATLVGFAMTFLLPARAGELVRPWMLSKETGVSASAAIATVFVERLFDLMAVLLLFCIWLALPAPPGTGSLDGVTALAAGVGAGAVAALTLAFVLAGSAAAGSATETALLRVLPARPAAALAALLRKFAGGLAVLRRGEPLLMTVALSLVLWTAVGFTTWVTSRAFDIAFPLAASFLISVVMLVGVAVPTPGSIGGFHVAYAFTVTRLFGATQEQAAACAIVLHAVSFVPATAVGLLVMAQAGLSLQRARTESAALKKPLAATTSSGA